MKRTDHIVIKIILVTCVLLVNDARVLPQNDDVIGRETCCHGMRSLRQLFKSWPDPTS